MFETSFFQRKVEDFVGAYTNDLLSRVYPSFIDALPSQARAPILDTISALQYRLAEYIAEMLKSEKQQAIERFVDKQVDELLERRVGDMVSDKSFGRAFDFVEQNLRRLIAAEGFESKVHEFVSGRLDDLARSDATLAETFTPKRSPSSRTGSINRCRRSFITSLRSRRVNQHAKTDWWFDKARSRRVLRTTLALQKDLHLSRTHSREVDELVNKTLPKRIEEYLRGPAFEQEAETFQRRSIKSWRDRSMNSSGNLIHSGSATRKRR